MLSTARRQAEAPSYPPAASVACCPRTAPLWRPWPVRGSRTYLFARGFARRMRHIDWKTSRPPSVWGEAVCRDVDFHGGGWTRRAPATLADQIDCTVQNREASFRSRSQAMVDHLYMVTISALTRATCPFIGSYETGARGSSKEKMHSSAFPCTLGHCHYSE